MNGNKRPKKMPFFYKGVKFRLIGIVRISESCVSAKFGEKIPFHVPKKCFVKFFCKKSKEKSYHCTYLSTVFLQFTFGNEFNCDSSFHTSVYILYRTVYI